MKGSSKPIPFGEIVSIGCSIGAVVAWAFLPWIKHPFFQASGLELIRMASPYVVQGSYSAMIFILIGSGIGLLGTLWGLYNLDWRPVARFVVLIGGGVGLVYFVLFVQQNGNPIDVTPYLESGFWVTLILLIGLIAQVLIPRPMGADYVG